MYRIIYSMRQKNIYVSVPFNGSSYPVLLPFWTHFAPFLNSFRARAMNPFKPLLVTVNNNWFYLKVTIV